MMGATDPLPLHVAGRSPRWAPLGGDRALATVRLLTSGIPLRVGSGLRGRAATASPSAPLRGDLIRACRVALVEIDIRRPAGPALPRATDRVGIARTELVG